MQKVIFLTFLILASVLFSACTTLKSQCDVEDDDHGMTKVEQFNYDDQPIYGYQRFYFTKLPPEPLVDFLNLHSINLVIDLRMNGSDKTLPDHYPAVYLGLPLDDRSTLTATKAKELQKHLEMFAEKSILFVSNDGDLAIAAFANYWAELHGLNEKWISHISLELGLKDPLLLNTWAGLLAFDGD